MSTVIKKNKQDTYQPTLCFGTFFILLSQARKNLGAGEKDVFDSEKHTVSEEELFNALQQIVFGNNSYEISSGLSAYKGCYRYKRIPCQSEATVLRDFNNKIDDDITTVVRSIIDVLIPLLDESRCETFVKSLIELLNSAITSTDKTPQINENEQYFVALNVLKNKSELLGIDTIDLSYFILGVYRYILNKCTDNTVGESTYNEWCPADATGKVESNSTRRKFVNGPTGASIEQQIKLIIPKPIGDEFCDPIYSMQSKKNESNNENMKIPEILSHENFNRFSIALSFAGEYREEYIEPIANRLAQIWCSKEKILYDRYHKEELARWNLNIYLPKLYSKDSDLIVVFIGKFYNVKPWCGFEWRAIQDFLTIEENEERVMFLRIDDGELNGYYGSLDGALPIYKDKTKETVVSIMKRYARVIGTLERSVSSGAKRHSLVAARNNTTGNTDLYPTLVANKILEKIRNQYPYENELHTFAQKTLCEDSSIFIRAEEGFPEMDLEYMLAKLLMNFSKRNLNSSDVSERIPRYLCDAIYLFEKEESFNNELLSECNKLKVESYSRLDGNGNELMKELLVQEL